MLPKEYSKRELSSSFFENRSFYEKFDLLLSRF